MTPHTDAESVECPHSTSNVIMDIRHARSREDHSPPYLSPYHFPYCTIASCPPSNRTVQARCCPRPRGASALRVEGEGGGTRLARARR
jgi:hypothetical protein